MSWQIFAPKEWTNAHLKFCFGKGGLTSKGVAFQTEKWLPIGEGAFKVDVLVSPNIIVEIDGDSHKRTRRTEKDAWKDRLLRDDGFRIFRFTDYEVNHSLEWCVNQVLEALS